MDNATPQETPVATPANPPITPFRARYIDAIPLRNRVARLIWSVVWAVLFRPFVGRPFRYWRVFLLRCFGAKIGKRCSIYANTHIWAPWNLTLGDYVAIGPGVQLYTVNKITIGSMVTISQRAYLCTASHDITKLLKPLIHRPIVIGDYAWVAAEAFVGMGTTIGEGAIVAARAVVVKDAPPWTVVAGNPARPVKRRTITP